MNIEEINNSRINDEKELTVIDDIYMTPEGWGDTYFGTKEDFKEMIDCKSGFGCDWYTEQMNDGISNIEEYEAKLLGELVSVEIGDDE